MKRMRFVLGCTIFLSLPAIGATSVSQPYRPINVTQQWTIEGQTFGLAKVRIMINGEVIGSGAVNATFGGTYDNRPVRVTCVQGRMRMATGADQSCSVYVDNELAANLIFVRN